MKHKKGEAWLDTCFVFQAVGNINPEFFTEEARDSPWRPKQYIDMIDYIPRTAIRHINLLDMIVSELTGHTYTGEVASLTLTYLKHYDDKHLSTKEKGFKRLTEHGKAVLRPWVEESKRESNRGFYRFVDTNHGSDFLKKAVDMAKELADLIAYTKKYHPDEKGFQYVLEHYRAKVRIRTFLSADLGENLIFDDILRQPASHGPAVILTEDLSEIREVKKKGIFDKCEVPVICVTLLGLFYALKEAGILDRIGFKESVTPATMHEHAIQTAGSRDPRKTHKHRENTDQNISLAEPGLTFAALVKNGNDGSASHTKDKKSLRGASPHELPHPPRGR